MSVLKQTTRTKLNIVVDHKSDLEVVLWVRANDFDSVVAERSLFLELENLAELLGAMPGLEKAIGNVQAFQDILFLLIFFCLRLRERCRCVIG